MDLAASTSFTLRPEKNRRRSVESFEKSEKPTFRWVMNSGSLKTTWHFTSNIFKLFGFPDRKPRHLLVSLHLRFELGFLELREKWDDIKWGSQEPDMQRVFFNFDVLEGWSNQGISSEVIDPFLQGSSVQVVVQASWSELVSTCLNLS